MYCKHIYIYMYMLIAFSCMHMYLPIALGCMAGSAATFDGDAGQRALVRGTRTLLEDAVNLNYTMNGIYIYIYITFK